MNIELRPACASLLMPGAFCLAMSWPWMLSLPLHMQLAACAALAIATWRTISTRKATVHQLRLEVHGGLAVVVGNPGKSLKVRSLRVSRLLSFYAELVLQLDDGQRVRLFVWPGRYGEGTFRYLRNYLLKKRKEDGFIHCTAM